MTPLAGTLRRRWNLTDIAGQSFGFYAADWRGFVAIGAGTIPLSLLSSLVGELIDDTYMLIGVYAALFVPSVVLYSLVEAAVIAHLVQIDEAKTPSEGTSFAAAFRSFWTLLRTSLLVALVVGGALAAGELPLVGLAELGEVAVPELAFYAVAIPAAYLGIRLLFSVQAVVLEGLQARAALKRSARLVSGRWWLTFGRTLFVSAIVSIVTLIFSLLTLDAPVGLYAVVSAIVAAFTGPYFSIALTLMYFDLRLFKAEEASVP